MHELKLIYYLFYGLFVAIRWIVVSTYKGIRWIVRKLRSGDAGASSGGRMPLARAPRAAPAARAPAPTAPALASVQVARSLAAIVAEAEKEADRCMTEEQNERFVETLNGYVAMRARALSARAAGGAPEAVAAANAAIANLGFVLRVIRDMAQQRRDPDKLLLLGDSDALAEACYRPLFEFARGAGVRLRSSRAATFLGDKDLAIFTGFIPVGLAPVILPSAWSTEVRWWPALAHEIGHDFHASVIGFDAELRSRAGLPPFTSLPRDGVALSRADLDAAYSAWLSEIFADTFGTLMLGAAFVTTMMWAFTDLKDPSSVITVDAIDAGGREGRVHEEHPPAHLRVVLACRLLSAIGFPGEADQLEDAWRKRHGSPDRLFVPTRGGRWYQVSEEPYVEYGVALVEQLYLGAFKSLGGVQLRSIPGLDLGPREHQAGLDARDAFIAGQPADTRDPRCLIAGAVLAATERPALSARVLAAARATIPAVGVSARQLRLRRAGASSGLAEDDGGFDLWKDAMLLTAALSPPKASKLRRRL